MAVSKAPGPPPGLEQVSSGDQMVRNQFMEAYQDPRLQAYAMQPPWTVMGVPGGSRGPPNHPPGYDAGPGPGYGSNSLNGAAKAALNLFANSQSPGNEERQRAVQQAQANARRLMNATLPRPKAGSVQPPSEPPSDPPEKRLEAEPKQSEASQSQSVSSGGPRYTGVLKGFKPENGYGFIECEELKKQYGCDVFMNQGIEGGIVVGSQVTFAVVLNDKGKPQARDAKRVEAEKSEETAVPEPGPKTSDYVGKVFKGTVKSFNNSRGFGFLSCSELQNTPFANRDIYVTQAQVPDQRWLTTGHEVEFTFALNQQGQPQAKNLKMMNTSPELDYLGELPTAQSVGDKLLRMG